MKTEEFNLSDKIFYDMNRGEELKREDVKEFIRLLKEEIENKNLGASLNVEEIEDIIERN